MQKKIVEQLLQLVRYSLWGEKIKNTIAPSQLKSIIRLSEEQTLQGVIINALLHCDLIKEKELVLRNYGCLLGIQKRNDVINNEIERINSFLKEEGIAYLMVKGQVAAQWYPNPLIRIPGDVDFLVRKVDVPDIERLLVKKFGIQPKVDVFLKHSEFVINGVMYEMHYDLIQFYSKRNRKYWDSLMKNEIPVNVKIADNQIPTLSPTTNTLYIFIHLFIHLIESGISLRQMCDWMMCIHANHNRIDYQLLSKHLKCLGLTNAYLSAGAILVDSLGLPQKEFGFIFSKSHRKKGRKILNDMITMGNFGKNKIVIYHNGFWHSIQTGIRIANQSLKFINLAPREISARWPGMVVLYIHSKLKISNK